MVKVIFDTVDKQHQQRAKPARPAGGDWGRLEVALTGAPCAVIERLAMQIIARLPGYRIGFADAAHGGEPHAEAVAVRFTQKNTGSEVCLNSRAPSFTRRGLFNDCDLVLVNGNHFTAEQQVVFLHPEKSLAEKTEQLTNVRLVVTASTRLPAPEQLQTAVEGVPRIPPDDVDRLVGFFQSLLMERIPPLNGLLLAGGKSLRMGSDKSLLQYHDKPQRAHVFELLQPLCREVFISCNAAQSAAIALPKIEDRFLGIGPAGGILSAFQSAPDSAWLTVATDLPYLGTATLEYLIAHRNPARLATAFVGHGDKPEPLIAIWEPRAYPVLLQALAMGVTCPRNVLMQSDIELLRPPVAGDLQNVNLPTERDAAMTAVQQP